LTAPLAWRQRKIRRRADFQGVYRTGEKRNGRFFNLFSQRRPEGTIRAGITVTRKSGGAVERNRLRRQLRALLVRLLVPLESFPVDVVFHVRPGVRRATAVELESELVRLLGSLEKGLRRNRIPPSALAPERAMSAEGRGDPSTAEKRRRPEENAPPKSDEGKPQ
jgi:ribonuclease P protein component